VAVPNWAIMSVDPISTCASGYAPADNDGARPVTVMLTLPATFAVVGVMLTDGVPIMVNVAFALSTGTAGGPARPPSVSCTM